MTGVKLRRLSSIFDQLKQPCLDHGLQPREIMPGTKKCPAKGWSANVPTVMARPGPSYGLGLRLGTRLLDGTYLVALDADRDEFVSLACALTPNSIGRLGKKGIARFMRAAEPTKTFKLQLADRSIAGEFLGEGALCVIPPTIHPETHRPYVWTDEPLLEIELESLPLVDPMLIKGVFASEHLAAIMSGEGTHDAMLRFCGQLVHFTNDDDWIERISSAALPQDYRGNSRDELTGMIKDARSKLASGKWATQLRSNVEIFPDITKSGRPRATLPNTKKAIELLGIECRYDLFNLQHSINGHNLDSYMTEAINDPALLRLREIIHERFGFDPSTDNVHTAVQTLANHHRFHPVRDYLDALRWDGEPRLDRWLVSYAGVEDTPYVRAVGGIMLIAAVRRVRDPGCKFDELPVLEGEQGNAKSQAIQVLAVNPEWFSDQKVFGLGGRDSIEALSGKWIVEAAELHGMRQGEVEGLKAFLSRSTDRGRMAYARTPTESKRQCIIIGTTNNDAYLRDLTGNRRFWPLATSRIDIEALKRDRDQLWAEAATREASGSSIRLPEELWPAASEQQQLRLIDNPFTSTLDEVLREKAVGIKDEVTCLLKFEPGKPMTGIITMEGLWTILGIRPGQRGQHHNENLHAAMKELGWVKTRRRIGGGRAYAYRRGDDDRLITAYPGDIGFPATVSYEDDGAAY
ncbi:hypothetical protein J2R76_005808 [Bradyrhizobium sp. USDA 4532]|uniref:VapE domain-containing protein n=1 Tax=unclassified Bradyrhizobium TaxID=2631580 RepID=UPI0020A14AB2|nr:MULTISPECIES: VapE domain-containing protein [unclassified Bradyrhizobium]MCP1829108.1 hypothetical protein [Bradyrhizobium sp. USDA 4545]MCP1922217.1 hypothetical protein [Bradyrhizobium sp. USDA 4532]